MPTNRTIESPNFEKIAEEAGQHTSDAISLLWQVLDASRAEERKDFRKATERLEPKVKAVTAAASVDNLDTEGASIVAFIGTTAQNFTGMRAPETGKSRIVIVLVQGSGTITAKHGATSETANQLVNTSGADV